MKELLLLIARAANPGDRMPRLVDSASGCDVHDRGFSFTLQFLMRAERFQKLVSYAVRLILCVMVVMSGSRIAASANLYSYMDRPVTAESENLRAEFRSTCEDDQIGNFSCPFELVVTEKLADTVVARVGRIRVTHLRIAPDERYIVALSNVASQQGPHVLVLRRDGSIAATRVITCGLSFLPRCDDGISDRVFWFGDEAPEPKVIEHEGQPVALQLWTRSFQELFVELGLQERKKLPDRFTIPLSCRAEAEPADNAPSCRSLGVKFYRSASAEAHTAALRGERIVLTLWRTYRLLDQGKLEAGLKELDACPDVKPAPCSCGHARHNLLARLGRSADAAALREKVLVKCREYIGQFSFPPHREFGAR